MRETDSEYMLRGKDHVTSNIRESYTSAFKIRDFVYVVRVKAQHKQHQNLTHRGAVCMFVWSQEFEMAT